MSLGKRLKDRREELNLTQSQLANLLGITKGAVGNYENNVSSPKEEILLKLFDVLNVEPNYLFQDSVNITTFEMTINEKDYIKKYRSLDETDKKAVNGLLDTLSKRRDTKEFINIQPPLLIPYYGKVASAGTGQYIFNDIPPEMIEIENNMENIQASFAIGVNGDSMEPTYKDGDTVLVKKQDKINIGEIGIFMIDGEAFVKELGNGVLISHNKAYADINITLDTVCIGKVLGKI